MRKIPIAKPLLGEEEHEALRGPILSGWVTQGPEVAAFEREFAGFTGSVHACAVSSCTTALHLALLGVGVQPGDEVITASHSFIATANAVRYCGASPVFVDIEPGTFNIDPAQIGRAVTSRTRAILCVHQVGMPCNLEAILPLAGTHGVKVIEDAACAIGSEILWENRWERIGKPHADVACFSFHPRKVITTGDGGMLTTDSEEMDQRFRLWRQHGMQVTDAVRHSSTEVIFEDYPCIGYNYRMTDLQAAVGRVQLKRLPGIIQRRRELAAHYTEVLAGVEGIILPGEPSWARSNWQTYLITLADEFSQRGVMQCLLDHGVSTRRGIMCAHREGAYADCPKPHPLPHSENAQDRTVAIPLFPQMTEEDQDYVVRCLRDALKSDCVRV